MSLLCGEWLWHNLMNIKFFGLNLDLIENSFDVIVCTSTLEHVVDIVGATRKLTNAIKPGGIAVFEVDWIYNREFPMHLPVNYEYKETWYTKIMPSCGMVWESGIWHKG